MHYVEYEIHFKNGNENTFQVEIEPDELEEALVFHNQLKEAMSTAFKNNLNGELEIQSTVGLVKIRFSEIQMAIINGLQ